MTKRGKTEKIGISKISDKGHWEAEKKIKIEKSVIKTRSGNDKNDQKELFKK